MNNKQIKAIKLVNDAIKDIQNDHNGSAKNNLQVAIVYLEAANRDKEYEGE